MPSTESQKLNLNMEQFTEVKSVPFLKSISI